MNENLLQYVWKNRLFNNQDLKTTKGESLQVLNVGQHNKDAGPDFFNARIKCGETILAGNIEVHIKSSDWKKHFHHKDQNYQNIILHVVHEDDEPIETTVGEQVLTLVLKHRIPRIIFDRYDDLQQLHPFIPCEQHWDKADKLTRDLWLQRMLVERLEMKCLNISKLLEETTNNWESAFYITLARNFGFKINALPFELLVKNIPLSVFAKNKTNLFQIEAILFGVAGFLNDYRIKTKYYKDLRKEYAYQKQKYKFKEIDVTLWKFLRLRPANFPQVRLAQFANLIYRSVHLFSKLTEQDNAKDIKGLFDCSATLFWDTHYTFSDESVKQVKHLGNDAIENIIINTVGPFLFLYRKTKGIQSPQDLTFELLEQVPAENNTIIKKWAALGTKVENATKSQALLQLKKYYCDEKLCLQCGIGLKILKEG
jgi:hypothetical protein